MISLTSLITAAILGMGVFKILCGVFELPTNLEYKMIVAVGKRKTEKISAIDNLVFWLSHYVVKLVKINPYRRKRLLIILKSLGIRDTPEMIYAKAFVRGALYVAIGFLLSIVTPILTAIFVLFGVYVMFKDFQITDKMMVERRTEIERELPRFVSRLEQELKYRQADVVGILEDYRRSTSGVLGDELELTISDMRSSNYEGALSRLEVRIGSSRLSEVVRGLIAVIRGDENVSHFHSLKLQFRTYERNNLNAEVEKRVNRTRRYSLLLLVDFMMTVLYPLIHDITSTLPQIF